MKLTYNVIFTVDNGYRCGCCYRDWKEEETVSIEVSEDESFFHKKSNHKTVFSILSEAIFTKGCENIKNMRSGDNFSGNFEVKFTFYNEDMESDVTFEFDEYEFKEFALDKRWKDYKKQVDTERDAEKKQVEESRQRAEFERLKRKFENEPEKS